MLLEVAQCSEFESEIYSPRNLISRPGTNEKRDRRKHVFLEYLDAAYTNPAPKHVENPLGDREPIEIEFAVNLSMFLIERTTYLPCSLLT